MVAGRARVMQQTDPRKVRLLFQGKARWNEIWDNNPRIAKPDEKGDFQPLHARGMDNLRPYHTGKTAERWTYNLNFRPDVGEIYFDENEENYSRKYSGRVILEPHIKPGASPNKQWGWVRWSKLAYLLQEKHGLKVTQLGSAGTPLLERAEHIGTPSFRLAAAVLAGARAAVLPEGGLHHAAAAVGAPAVVLMMGFTPVELTGYAGHVNLGASLGDACGNRQPCKHCAEWAARIKPEQVCDELLKILERKSIAA